MRDQIYQCAGVDVGLDEFHVRLLERRITPHHTSPPAAVSRGYRKFDNTPAGHDAFGAWLRERNPGQAASLRVVMEASGVYFEALAHTLHEAGFAVSVVLANTVKHFGLSLNEHSKTDVIDAGVIARLGIERPLAEWRPYSPASRRFKLLTREREAIIAERTAVKNRHHSARYAKFVSPRTLERYVERVAFLDAQLAAIAGELEDLLAGDDALARAVCLLETIPGVGRKTAISVIAETDGFALFNSRAQLVKYCGMDVVSNQSGTSLDARTRISKKGNRYLRKALYFPSLSACRKGIFEEVYTRQYTRSASKMSALVAVQRKLLITAYALIKTDTPYEADFHKGRRKSVGAAREMPAAA